MAKLNDMTVAADIGARYGIHPTWNNFDAPVHHIAFEPDPEEAERLREIYQQTASFKYEVEEKALDKVKGKREFYLTRHRGLSSCLKPDLASECFRHLKPGQAEIDETLEIDMETGDDVFEELGLFPDFLKVDTEGTEQDVIEGFDAMLEKGILGVRASTNFQPCFHGQRLFSDSDQYLQSKGFVLLNLDYEGFGFPRLGLFRKPDPMTGENHRYGILVHADAVWVIKESQLDALFSGDENTIARLKLAAFCFNNFAPDYAVDLMRETAEKGGFSDDVEATRLYQVVRLKAARFLGRYRTVPDEQWDRARGIYKDIFGEELGGGSDFYPQMNKMVNELKKSA